MRRVPVMAAVAGALVTDASAAVPQPHFRSTVVVATQTSAAPPLSELAAGDFNGDGNVDVVATYADFDDPRPLPVVVYAGDGRGHFSDQTTRLFDGRVPTTFVARRTVVADFNGDRRPDVFIADTGLDAIPFPGAPNTLILSAPGGKLVDASGNLPREPDYTHSAAAADVDGNGTTDLYAGNLWEGWAGGTVVPPQILLNDGTGHFRVEPAALPDDMVSSNAPHYDGAGFADVDGDHAPDLVLLGAGSYDDRLLLNDGAGRFRDGAAALPPKPWGTANGFGLDVASLDVNGDTHADLLLGFTKASPFFQGRWIQVLVNDGTGVFRDETATRLPQQDNDAAWPDGIRIADLNKDGKADIGVAVSSFPANERPPIYLNRGDGTFKPLAATAGVVATRSAFLFLDANRDGRADLYSTEALAPGRSFLALQLAPPKPVPRCKRKPKPKGCR